MAASDRCCADVNPKKNKIRTMRFNKIFEFKSFPSSTFRLVNF